MEHWSFHQISSNTTLLFWVFNQTVPCWLAVILIINSTSFAYNAFVWGLSFFFSPIAAVGQLPFLLLNLLGLNEEILSFSLKKYLQTMLRTLAKSLQSSLFYLGLLIFVISASFFTANILKVDIIFPSVTPEGIIIVLLAFLLEGGILILLLLKNEKRNPYLWMILVVFMLSLLLIIGPFNFGMRFVIPTTFLLMLYSAKALVSGKQGLKIALLVILLLGSVTAIFEINRSVYRTWVFYTASRLEENAYAEASDSDLIEFPFPENAHPYSLVADDLLTLSNTEIINNWNYYGDLNDHWLTRTIFKQP